MSKINKWTSCDSNNIKINNLAGCGCTKTVYYIDDSNKKAVI